MSCEILVATTLSLNDELRGDDALQATNLKDAK
jgi:hypothetical protein